MNVDINHVQLKNHLLMTMPLQKEDYEILFKEVLKMNSKKIKKILTWYRVNLLDS
jgi:hypothetical protein